MSKKMLVFSLITYGLTNLSAYGCNPASTCYVDRGLASLQSQIANITAGPRYAVGQSVFGGKIFYLDSTGQHGLIAATADEPGGAIYTWGDSTTLRTAQYQCGVNRVAMAFG
jgi:hypothetical protein